MGNFLIRLVLFLTGLLFAASLTVAALLLAMVWGLRWGWARLTGRPMAPWAMRFDPFAGFEKFRDAARRRADPTAADVVNARSRGESARSPILLGQHGDVSDAVARPSSPSSSRQ